MPNATLNGLTFHFERAGSGPPLLFISGTGGDLRTQPNVFASPLARTFDLLAYDQRGLGRTDKPDVPYSMADYADDAAALLDHVGWDEALVMGASFGGMVAQELALRHPARVKRLVLACTSPGGEGGASFPFHDIEHLKGEDRARHMIPISDVRRDAAWAATHPADYEKLVELGSADPFAGEPGRAEGAHRQLEARRDHDTWDRLPQIACPTLIAAGRYDGIALPSAQEKMAARIPGAALQWFEGGHLFMLQDRAAYPAMIAFLNG
ncbi:MAG: alpha/beta hydrolase [Alphaproteobacteria bacterium]|nr:alpha/beta hydrolase [Alphaproteobacteria bacterium]MBU1512837.1 alpha/beta hydrolase [Alphaproteobacteria bacterium]MBU2095727.1 alpha/beta hydrolase [Alphaproteobacteria bacterium]MBU2153183.1 alpha/beta hydrolase [Alphaproteobacteria bacterium]MBU2309005.1 alpha/beta hydrolase [Alphaproteobacteria bacterium]